MMYCDMQARKLHVYGSGTFGAFRMLLLGMARHKVLVTACDTHIYELYYNIIGHTIVI